MFRGSHYIYYGMYLVGFAILMIINLKDHERYKISRKNAVLYSLYTYVCGVVGAILMGKIYSALNSYLGFKADSTVAIFGAVVFTPFLLLVFPIKRGEWKKALDMLTPGILIILACAKFGCSFAGCCAGFVWEHGIYNPIVGEKVFPIQVCEFVTMLIVLFVTQAYIRKSKHFVVGTAYPITFAVYSVTRFVWEFFRYYKYEELRTIIFGMTFWQFICLLVFVSSVTIIIVSRLQQKKKSAEMISETVS